MVLLGDREEAVEVSPERCGRSRDVTIGVDPRRGIVTVAANPYASGNHVGFSQLPEVRSPPTSVKRIADQFELAVWLYDEVDWWAPSRDAFVDREEHTSGFSARIDGYDQRVRSDANKLTVVGKPELVAPAEQLVLSELGSHVSASKSKPRFLDVTSYGIHKGTVVVRLADLLKIPTNRVAVIGDGPNDVEMFKQAGLSIAMGQGVDEVKEAANYLTTSNDDEGWARGIEQYVLGTSQSATG